MRNYQGLLTLVVICILLFNSSCKKENEVPPRNKGYVREYALPPPPFLTSEERDIVTQKRNEYNALSAGN